MAKNPLPPGVLQAVVEIQHRKWLARYEEDGKAKSASINSTDAWNFDIERGLKIQITIEGSECHILRKQGAKKYVVVDHVADVKR